MKFANFKSSGPDGRRQGPFVSVRRDSALHISRDLQEKMDLTEDNQLCVAFDNGKVFVGRGKASVPRANLIDPESSALQTGSYLPSNEILDHLLTVNGEDKRVRLYYTGDKTINKGITLYRVAPK